MTTGLGKITDFVRERFNGKKPDKYNEFIANFETGVLTGVIPEPNHTYNVMSHGNEHGVVIAETTHGGIAKLATLTMQKDAGAKRLLSTEHAYAALEKKHRAATTILRAAERRRLGAVAEQ